MPATAGPLRTSRRSRRLSSIGSDLKKGAAMRAYMTKNDLPSNARSAVISLLNENLAAAIDLALATKQAHWNLKGPQFIAIHEMVDGFRTELDDHVDAMAERVVQLGGTALGSLQSVSQATKLKPYPTDIHAVPAHLVELIERYGAVANMVRRGIDGSAAAGDPTTADIFTAASRALDKALWFLEAHLPGEL
jgi:starvation-inducible DNA-binding protein